MMKNLIIENRAKQFALSLFHAGRSLIKEDQTMMQPPAGTAPPQEPAMQQPPPGPEQNNSVADNNGQNLSVETLIERLNVIRGGKSFAEPEVHSQLNSIYQNIQEQDKITLDRILIDIGKAVQETQQNNAPAPSNGQTPPQQTPVQSAGAQQPARAMQPPPIAAQ